MKLYIIDLCYFNKENYSVRKTVTVVTRKKKDKIFIEHDFFENLQNADVIKADSNCDIFDEVIKDINQFNQIRILENGKLDIFGSLIQVSF